MLAIQTWELLYHSSFFPLASGFRDQTALRLGLASHLTVEKKPPQTERAETINSATLHVRNLNTLVLSTVITRVYLSELNTANQRQHPGRPRVPGKHFDYPPLTR